MNCWSGVIVLGLDYPPGPDREGRIGEVRVTRDQIPSPLSKSYPAPEQRSFILTRRFFMPVYYVTVQIIFCRHIWRLVVIRVWIMVIWLAVNAEPRRLAARVLNVSGVVFFSSQVMSGRRGVKGAKVLSLKGPLCWWDFKRKIHNEILLSRSGQTNPSCKIHTQTGEDWGRTP